LKKLPPGKKKKDKRAPEFPSKLSSLQIVWASMAIMVVAETVKFVWGHSHEGAPWWHEVPLFYSVYGVVGCMTIVIVSKKFGKWFLQKKEDYYD